MLSIFSMVWSLLGYGWKLICWAGGILWKLATGSFHMGIKLIGGIIDLIMTPFTWGLDRLWDMGLWVVFGWGLAALLTACVIIALMALASNACRRLKRR